MGITQSSGSDLDKYISYSSAEDKLVTSKSIINRPSSFYLGDGMAISNGIQALQIDLPTGEEGLALVQPFDRVNGTTESPHDFVFENAEVFDVNINAAEVLTDIPTLTLTSSKDAGYSGVFIYPASTGRLVIEGTLNADGSSDVLYAIYDITQQHVDDNAPLFVEFPNLMVAPINTDLYVNFSGVSLKGFNNVPYLQVVRLPYNEIALTDGFIYTSSSDNTLRIGTEYLVNTQSREVTLTVPESFKDSFTVVDFKGRFGDNKCTVDFSAFDQGTAVLNAKGDVFKFYKIGDNWYYHNFNFNNNSINVGDIV